MDQVRDIDASVDSETPAAPRDRDFALAHDFARVDDDSRPISEIPEADLLHNFGD